MEESLIYIALIEIISEAESVYPRVKMKNMTT